MALKNAVLIDLHILAASFSTRSSDRTIDSFLPSEPQPKKKEHSLLFVNQTNERTSGVVHDNATNDNSIGRSVFWVEQCKIDHSMRYTPSLRLSLQNWLWIDKRNHSGGVFPDFRTLPKPFYVMWKKAFGIRPHTSTHTHNLSRLSGGDILTRMMIRLAIYL